jgi:hypothetical protein
LKYINKRINIQILIGPQGSLAILTARKNASTSASLVEAAEQMQASYNRESVGGGSHSGPESTQPTTESNGVPSLAITKADQSPSYNLGRALDYTHS